MFNKLLTKLVLIVGLFIFVGEPVFATTIVSSPENVSVSAVVGNFSTPLDDNGGGGGMLTGLVFSGWAYPGATVHVWKDGVPKATTVANSAGFFSITLTELYNPNVLYTLYAIDKSNRKSILLNYPIVAKIGYLTQVSGIRFPPTISLDKSEVKVDGSLTVSGYALPNALLNIVIEGIRGTVYNVNSNPDGTYDFTIPFIGLKKGDYNIHTNYQNDRKISKVLQFTVGESNILTVDQTNNIPGDCNADQIINITDFSVAAFWYGKPNPPRCIDTNNDNIINLVDFSILAFYWTG